MQRLLEIMRALRAPDGCPWDREQTHESLRPHLLEEAAEAVDALGHGTDADAVEELGDVLLHIAFHAVIAEEEGAYDYQAIEEAIVGKLVRRHPHVFGDRDVDGADAVVANWEAIKAEERAAAGKTPATAADAVPRSLPALKRAAALDRALGWELPADDAELSPAAAGDDPDRLGRLLLAAAQAARRAGLDPEILLRDVSDARARDADRRASGGPADGTDTTDRPAQTREPQR